MDSITKAAGEALEDRFSDAAALRAPHRLRQAERRVAENRKGLHWSLDQIRLHRGLTPKHRELFPIYARTAAEIDLLTGTGPLSVRSAMSRFWLTLCDLRGARSDLAMLEQLIADRDERDPARALAQALRVAAE